MLPSGLPESVQPEEDLARFVTSSSYYSRQYMKVKGAAFMPNPNDNYTTSVFRHGAEPRDALWRIGTENITSSTLHGAGIVSASGVRSALLEVEAKEPPDRHANIVGWSIEDDLEVQKAKQKMQAASLAEFARLVLPR